MTAPPAQRINTAPAPAIKPSPHPLQVLIVEDQPDIARVMQALIQRAGHRPRWAPTGPDAAMPINAARTWPSSTSGCRA